MFCIKVKSALSMNYYLTVCLNTSISILCFCSSSYRFSAQVSPIPTDCALFWAQESPSNSSFSPLIKMHNPFSSGLMVSTYRGKVQVFKNPCCIISVCITDLFLFLSSLSKHSMIVHCVIKTWRSKNIRSEFIFVEHLLHT